MDHRPALLQDRQTLPLPRLQKALQIRQFYQALRPLLGEDAARPLGRVLL